MKIKIAQIKDITPYDRNPRNHDVDAIAKSIREFGWRQPIVVDKKNVIVAGHGRYYAAKQLGLDRVPVHVATELTQEQIRAYRLADNQTAELATWNDALLKSELEALKELDYDLGLLGFSPDTLASIMTGSVVDGNTDPDEIPAPPDKPITEKGDIWILGDHRLMCGDSSLRSDFQRLMAGNRIHLVNMDPPYNVKVEPRSNNAIVAGLSSFESTSASKMLKGGQGNAASFGVDHKTGKAKNAATHKQLRAKDRPLANDFVSDAEFVRLLDAWFANACSVLELGRSFYIWGGYANVANYPPALVRQSLKFAQCIIWHKQHPVMTRKDFMGDHEWCFYGWKEGAGHVFFGPKNVTDVWQVKKVPPQNMVHLTEKPVELAVRAMQYSSRPGENVLDLFGGSGSTLIGAEQTGRNAFLMELDQLYCDVIVKRWENFTGKKAVREGEKKKLAPSKPKAKKQRSKKPVSKKRKRLAIAR